MSTFYLIRHGLRLSRAEDTWLSEAGVAQADALGEYFSSKHISQLFVSPTNRTMQTAEVINRQLQLVQTIDARLRERMEYRPEYGTFEQFLHEFDKTMADRSHQPPFGDSAIAAGNRLLGLLEEIDQDGSFLLISHGGVIGDLVRNIFAPEDFSLTTDPVKNLQWLNIPECSVTEIERTSGSYTLKKVGDTSHCHAQASSI